MLAYNFRNNRWLSSTSIIGNNRRPNYSYLPTCLKQKAGQNSWKSGTFGLKAGRSYKFDKKYSDKLVLKRAGQSDEKKAQFLSPACRLLESCLAYTKPGSNDLQNQSLWSWNGNVSFHLWQEGHTSLSHPPPPLLPTRWPCVAGLFEKLAPLSWKLFLRQWVYLL